MKVVSAILTVNTKTTLEDTCRVISEQHSLVTQLKVSFKSAVDDAKRKLKSIEKGSLGQINQKKDAEEARKEHAR